MSYPESPVPSPGSSELRHPPVPVFRLAVLDRGDLGEEAAGDLARLAVADHELTLCGAKGAHGADDGGRAGAPDFAQGARCRGGPQLGDGDRALLDRDTPIPQ